MSNLEKGDWIEDGGGNKYFFEGEWRIKPPGKYLGTIKHYRDGKEELVTEDSYVPPEALFERLDSDGKKITIGAHPESPFIKHPNGKKP